MGGRATLDDDARDMVQKKFALLYSVWLLRKKFAFCMLQQCPYYMLGDILAWLSFDDWLACNATCRSVRRAGDAPLVKQRVHLRASCGAVRVCGATPALRRLADAGNVDALLVCAQHLLAERGGGDDAWRERCGRAALRYFERYFARSHWLFASPGAFGVPRVVVLDAGRVSRDMGVISFLHLNACYHLRMAFFTLPHSAENNANDGQVEKCHNFDTANDARWRALQPPPPPYRATDGVQAEFEFAPLPSNVPASWIVCALHRLHRYYGLLDNVALDQFSRESLLCSAPEFAHADEVSLSYDARHDDNGTRSTLLDDLRSRVRDAPVYIDAAAVRSQRAARQRKRGALESEGRGDDANAVHGCGQSSSLVGSAAVDAHFVHGDGFLSTTVAADASATDDNESAAFGVHLSHLDDAPSRRHSF